MSNGTSSARRRRTWAIAIATPALLAVRPSLHAQAAKDTSRADSSRTQRLERVMISAVRASGAAPISQKTLTQADLEPRYFGQDVPLLLQGAAPSLTSYAETG